MRMRTPKEVGEQLRERRERIGLSQDDFDGISPAQVGKVERGVAPKGARARNRIAHMRGLRWPDDAFQRLALGEDPATFEELPEPADEAPPWEELLASQRQVTEALERLAELVERRG